MRTSRIKTCPVTELWLIIKVIFTPGTRFAPVDFDHCFDQFLIGILYASVFMHVLLPPFSLKYPSCKSWRMEHIRSLHRVNAFPAIPPDNNNFLFQECIRLFCSSRKSRMSSRLADHRGIACHLSSCIPLHSFQFLRFNKKAPVNSSADKLPGALCNFRNRCIYRFWGGSK